VNWSPAGVVAKSNRTANGYTLEIAIPWDAIHHTPKKNVRLGFHAAILETSNGMHHTYIEPVAGNVTEAPYTWSPLFLTD
jgi:hypothetical protein